MLKKMWFFIAFMFCMVSCGDDGLSQEEIQEQEFRESIVGTWVYDHPELGHWEEWICTASGKIYVSYVAGLNMEEVQLEKKSGNYTISGNKLSTVLDGGSVTDFVLSSVNDAELTYVLNSLGKTFTHSRQLGEVTLKRGETMKIDVEEFISLNEVFFSFKSHNQTIAEVDSNGKVTAKEPGFTYIDVATSAGSRVLRVNVKDGNNLFPDYSSALSMNAQQVKECWGNNYYYDKEDGIAYLINNDYVTNVLFFTDGRKDVTGVWLLLNKVQTEKEARKNAVHTCLSTKYTYLETNEDGVMMYCNIFNDDELFFYVLYSPDEEAISYVKGTLNLWKDYSLDFGKTASQLKTEYGEPAMIDEDGWIYYIETNDYVDYCAYVLNESTRRVYEVYAMLHEDFDGQTIVDELDRKYVYFENGSAPSESIYAFINEEETVGVIFYGSLGILVYVDIPAENSRVTQDWIPSVENVTKGLCLRRSI